MLHSSSDLLKVNRVPKPALSWPHVLFTSSRAEGRAVRWQLVRGEEPYQPPLRLSRISLTRSGVLRIKPRGFAREPIRRPKGLPFPVVAAELFDGKTFLVVEEAGDGEIAPAVAHRDRIGDFGTSHENRSIVVSHHPYR